VKQSRRPPPMAESDWTRLVDVEQRLEAEIAAARADATARVAAARADGAAPDLAQLAAIAAQEERVDTERHLAALARLEADADALVQRLADVADARIDALARWALQAALAGVVPPEAA